LHERFVYGDLNTIRLFLGMCNVCLLFSSLIRILM
jgi:hypothetical protein